MLTFNHLAVVIGIGQRRQQLLFVLTTAVMCLNLKQPEQI